MINMEAVPKFDIKSDISTKLTTWIGQKNITKQKIILMNLKKNFLRDFIKLPCTLIWITGTLNFKSCMDSKLYVHCFTNAFSCSNR